eukprot:8562175-Pyramimonas_sp.AAC.1
MHCIEPHGGVWGRAHLLAENRIATTHPIGIPVLFCRHGNAKTLPQTALVEFRKWLYRGGQRSVRDDLLKAGQGRCEERHV